MAGMFPNPQDALPLPRRPDLGQYRELATSLVNACRSNGDAALRDWASRWVQALARDAAPEVPPGMPVSLQRWIDDVHGFARRELADGCALPRAQFVIARSHGFESWPEFAEHVEALSGGRSHVRNFEAAADAIVAGDEDALAALLRDDPELVRMRSTREHRATLLHYVSANGVEGYRQRTPRNAPRIARMLLDAGAEVDAEANVYGGRCTTLGLTATSVHPERAGVAEELMQLLLDRGAALDHPSMCGSRHSAVTGCLANGRPRAAAFLADRGAPLDLSGAAGTGRIDAVRKLLAENPPRQEIQRAFLYACGYGHDDVVALLLDRGADLADPLETGLTALHWAVVGGHVSTIELLLARGADVEVRNAYGGTAVDQAEWSRIHSDEPADWERVIGTLRKGRGG